jgi:hypothetical protein
VSPFVDGRSVKGPTEAFCEQAGIARSATGIVRAYSEVIDGLVADEEAEQRVPQIETPTLMETHEDRVRLADQVLAFADSLRSTR